MRNSSSRAGSVAQRDGTNRKNRYYFVSIQYDRQQIQLYGILLFARVVMKVSVCHFSESRSTSLHSVRPQCFITIRSVFQLTADLFNCHDNCQLDVWRHQCMLVSLDLIGQFFPKSAQH